MLITRPRWYFSGLCCHFIPAGLQGSNTIFSLNMGSLDVHFVLYKVSPTVITEVSVYMCPVLAWCPIQVVPQPRVLRWLQPRPGFMCQEHAATKCTSEHHINVSISWFPLVCLQRESLVIVVKITGFMGQLHKVRTSVCWDSKNSKCTKIIGNIFYFLVYFSPKRSLFFQPKWLSGCTPNYDYTMTYSSCW